MMIKIFVDIASLGPNKKGQYHTLVSWKPNLFRHNEQACIPQLPSFAGVLGKGLRVLRSTDRGRPIQDYLAIQNMQKYF